jgi:hypothetical protein
VRAGKLEALIEALVDTVVRRDGRLSADVPLAHVVGTATELMARLDDMPVHLGQGLKTATHMFNQAARAHGGRSFLGAEVKARTRALDAWSRSAIGVQRDFVDFYEKMGLFIYRCLEEAAEAPSDPGSALPADWEGPLPDPASEGGQP